MIKLLIFSQISPQKSGNPKTKIRKSENPESKNRVDFDDALIARVGTYGLQHASAVLGMLFCEGSCGRVGGGVNRYIFSRGIYRYTRRAA